MGRTDQRLPEPSGRHEGIGLVRDPWDLKIQLLLPPPSGKTGMSGDLSRGAASGQIVPVDQGLLAKLPAATTSMESGLDICLRNYKIHVTEATPPGLLSTVLRVIRDAE